MTGAFQRDIAALGDFPESVDRLRATRRYGEAISACREKLTEHPDNAVLRTLFATALYEGGQEEDAEREFRAAAAAATGFTLFEANFANFLFDRGQFAESLIWHRRALASDPDNPVVLANYASALDSVHEFDAGLEAIQRAIAKRPGHAMSECKLAFNQLRRGDFEHGWRSYEARLRLPDNAALSPADIPRWRGEDVKGRTILLIAEQGLGDTVQFIRYAPFLAARGAKVIVEAPRPLQRLIASVEGVTAVTVQGAKRPMTDFHCPLMSLPLMFGTSLATVPAPIPYLNPPAALADAWRKRLDALRGGGALRVGLVWAGAARPEIHAANAIDRRRSLDADLIAPLFDTPGISFVSLQKGRPEGEVTRLAQEFGLVDLADKLGDFADTAALILALDLVIAVDTSVAHVAGALGRPIWTLSRFDACWRWLDGRSTSPWYPSMRLFMQPAPGAWPEVITSVSAQLRRLAQQHQDSWKTG